MSFEEIEGFIYSRVTSGAIPGCVLSAVTATGEIVYSQSCGPSQNSTDNPWLNPDSVFWIASLSKIISIVGILRCVESGLLSLDEPLDKILPELVGRQVIVQDGDGGFTLEPPKSSITLRHLLIHTSGLDIDFIHPLLQAWRASRGEEPMFVSGHVFKAHEGPLTFHPGEGLSYGGGVDYALYAATRVSGSTSPEAFLREKVLDPLGMTSTTFHPERHPGIMKRLVPTLVRQDDGTLQPGPRSWPIPTTDEAGAIGLYSTVSDMQKILQELIRDSPTLLQKETINHYMFQPQFAPDAQPLQEFGEKIPLLGHMCGVLKPDGINMAIGGLLFEQGDDEFHPEGTLTWGGLPNTFWFANRQRNLAGVYLTQLSPPLDATVRETYRAWVKALWARKP